MEGDGDISDSNENDSLMSDRKLVVICVMPKLRFEMSYFHVRI